MLIKHKNGQVIDYSMIIHLPAYGDLEAVKSSEYETAFSGNDPAEIFMEFADGTQLHTADFVAENSGPSEATILDKAIITKLADMACRTSPLPMWMDEVSKVWALHDEFTDHWTIGVEYLQRGVTDPDFPEDEWPSDEDACAFINSVKVYFLPCQNTKKKRLFNETTA